VKAQQIQLNIQEKINQILWGKVIVQVDDCCGNSLPFILRSLTSAEINYLDFIYRQELCEAFSQGLVSEEDLTDIYIQQELWTDDDDVYVRGLKKKIKLLKEQVQQFQFLKARRKLAENKLRQTKKELLEKEIFKNQLFMLSAENRAEEIKRRHMIMMCSENMSETANQCTFHSKYFDLEKNRLYCLDSRF